MTKYFPFYCKQQNDFLLDFNFCDIVFYFVIRIFYGLVIVFVESERFLIKNIVYVLKLGLFLFCDNDDQHFEHFLSLSYSCLYSVSLHFVKVFVVVKPFKSSVLKELNKI